MKYIMLTAALLPPALLAAEPVSDAELTNEQNAVEKRLADERETSANPFVLTPHKPNYLLFANVIDNPPQDLYTNVVDLQDVEVKFQLSMKMPLWVSTAKHGPAVVFAYSQVSNWQAYNKAESSPFRETNYEPEMFVAWQPDYNLVAGWSLQLADVGIVHQSNGRSEPLSRSWNRVKARFGFEQGRAGVLVIPWYRIPEEAKDDNNPDIDDYMGHGEIRAAYKWHDHTFSVMSRNMIESGFSKGGMEASWSFPVTSRIKGYVQVFSGYGNNLIEYNHYNNTVGVGVALTDWL